MTHSELSSCQKHEIEMRLKAAAHEAVRSDFLEQKSKRNYRRLKKKQFAANIFKPARVGSGGLSFFR